MKKGNINIIGNEEFPIPFKSYYLLDRLATGGMAEIFRAVTKDGVNRVVVIKQTHPQFQNNPEFINMFRDEIKITAQLSHKNIIHVNSYGTAGEYIEMEYVRGKTVRQIFKQVRDLGVDIPQDIVIYVIQESARGLFYAHNFKDERTSQSLKIIHRDISPQNIIVGYDGSVKVFDFGIAKALSQLEATRVGVVKGKIAYMSPEQINPHHEIDHRTDIFSLGVVLWEMLTNKKLFTAKEEYQILELLKECKIDPPSAHNPKVTPLLDQITLKSLKRDPAERYQTMDEFVQALSQVPKKDFINRDIATQVSQWAHQIFKNDYQEEVDSLKRALTKIPETPIEEKKMVEKTSVEENQQRPRLVTSSSIKPPSPFVPGLDTDTFEKSIQKRKMVEEPNSKTLKKIAAAFIGLILACLFFYREKIFILYNYMSHENQDSYPINSNMTEVLVDGVPKDSLVIMMDGKFIGNSVPLKLAQDVSKGPKEISISREGYQVFKGRIFGENLFFNLKSLQSNLETQWATLKIKSKVPPDQILIDDVLSPDPPNNVRVPRNKRFVLTVKAKGFRPFNARVMMRSPKDEVQVSLLKVDTGRIDVETIPQESEIEFKNIDTGEIVARVKTPVKNFELPIGNYLVTAKNPLLSLKEEKKVSISYKKTTAIKLRLRPE